MNALFEIEKLSLSRYLSHKFSFVVWLDYLLIPLIYGFIEYQILMLMASQCDKNTTICTVVDQWGVPLVFLAVAGFSIYHMRKISKQFAYKNLLSLWTLFVIAAAFFTAAAMSYVLFN